MASGKLSPRQKMINMMYLVLLALLAMNVSAEILNAFQVFKDKLGGSAIEANSNSSDFMSLMKETINEEIKNENKRTNAGLLDTLDLIKGETSKIIGTLNKHISHLESEIILRDPETNKLVNLGETEKNLQYWMGQGDAQESNDGRGEGAAFELHQQLDGYVKYIVDMYNGQLKDKSQGLNLQEEIFTQDATPENTQDGEAKTWEFFTFEGPAIANTAMLEKIKLDIYEKEKSLLDLLNSRLGVATFKADKVVAINAPISTIVPAGLQFQTKLYVAMSSSQIQPKFSSGSGSMKVEDDGGAILTVGARGGSIPKGKNEGKQSYSYTVQVPKATGGFETINRTEEFTVRKPEVVITSAAIQILYSQCGNDVNIDVPALGDQYNPSVAVNNGSVIPNKKSKKKFRIVPTGKTCRVAVSSVTNGQKLLIGNVDYKVIRPPKPSIDMRVNGKQVKGPVPKSSRVQVRLEADPDFASALPQDARYGIGSVEVKAQLSLGPPTTVNRVNTGGKNALKPINITMGTQVRQARPGTAVYIILNDIYRTNFQNKKVIDKRFSEVERTLQVVVK